MPGLPDGSHFTAVSCAGEGSGAVCSVAAYIGQGTDEHPGNPALVVSMDAGKTWKVKTVEGIPDDLKQSPILSLSCTGSGSKAVCAAAGWMGMLAVSGDAGNHWVYKPLPDSDLPSDFLVMLLSVSCTGSGETALCATAGSAISIAGSVGTPIYLSSDSGKTWEAKTSIAFPYDKLGGYTVVSCTGGGTGAVCAAGGGTYANRDGSSMNPFLTASINGGNDWDVIPIPGLSYGSGKLSSLSCTGSGPAAVCVASGWVYDLNSRMLYVSTDGGRTWTFKSEHGMPKDDAALFHSVSCTGNEPTSLCVAAGASLHGKSSLLVSADGG